MKFLNLLAIVLVLLGETVANVKDKDNYSVADEYARELQLLEARETTTNKNDEDYSVPAKHTREFPPQQKDAKGGDGGKDRKVYDAYERKYRRRYWRRRRKLAPVMSPESKKDVIADHQPHHQTGDNDDNGNDHERDAAIDAHDDNSDGDSKELDCHMRQLMYSVAKRNVESWRRRKNGNGDHMLDIYDALEIETSCAATTMIDSSSKSRDNNNNGESGSRRRSNSLHEEELLSDTTQKLEYGNAEEGEIDNNNGRTEQTSNNDNDFNYYYVCPISGIDHQKENISDGNHYSHPFLTIQRAIDETRKQRRKGGSDNMIMQVIILKKGIHFINETIVLTPDDSNLIIKGEDDDNGDGNEESKAWISGGILINSTTTKWTKLNERSTKVNSLLGRDVVKNIWVADLTSLLPSGVAKNDKIKLITGLFTTYPYHNRMTLARYPNANVEEWNAKKRYVPSNVVEEWIFPPYGNQPKFNTIDLSQKNNPTGHVKSDSSMDDYNKFSVGIGGVCSTVWGDQASYWCSDHSAGGWAEVDRAAAIAGRLNIPIGMKILSPNSPPSDCENKDDNGEEDNISNNPDNNLLRIIQKWGSNDNHNNGRGAIIHVAHSQGWAWHMFNISSINNTTITTTSKTTATKAASKSYVNAEGKKDGKKRLQSEKQQQIQKQQEGLTIKFDKGGWQGGRNWQCTDKNGHLSNCNGDDKKLHGGDWYVEGILEELDSPGEFYFDYDTNLLYLYPPPRKESSSSSEDEKDDKRHYHQLLRHLNQRNNNNSTGSSSSASGQHTKDDSDIPNLTATKLQTLIRLSGTMNNPVRNVHIQNINFRDASKTYMEQWSAPSGGDWSLHKSGAVWLDDGTENITISDCVFTRLDGNAIMISGYARYVTIRQSEFTWLGNGAIATWGNTINNGYDATNGEQPQFCTMENNIVSNIGLYEKQSSGWGQNKAYQSTIRNNVMFNLPRAAINFNDGMGGGNIIHGNVIFNTCRESGDHGPINSWDRMPFLTNASGLPSFTPLVTHTQQNIIMANYGASEGFDNDDGSSYYHTHDNVYYIAHGFKMDYGGHDSIFNNNLIINSDKCFGTGYFLKDHVDKVFNNTCILTSNVHNRNSNNTVGVLYQCAPDGLILYNNTYYTNNGNALWSCAWQNAYTLTDIQNELGLEMGSTQSITPPTSTIISWAKEKLHIE